MNRHIDARTARCLLAQGQMEMFYNEVPGRYSRLTERAFALVEMINGHVYGEAGDTVCPSCEAYDNALKRRHWYPPVQRREEQVRQPHPMVR
jgi:hypothetical protein